MTTYPAQIDDTITLPPSIDNISGVNAGVANGLRSAIIAIENQLGLVPAGIYTTVRNRLDSIEAAIGSGGGFIPGGDLAGTTIIQTVIGLHGNPVASTMPVSLAVPIWSGSIYSIRQLTQDDILPGFSINSFTGGSTVEIGATVSNPSFAASYSSLPVSAQITNTDSIDSPLVLSSPFTSGTVVGSFHHTSATTITFTLSAVGSSTKTSTQSIAFQPRSFGGIGTAGATGATASGSSANLVGATGALSSEGLHSSDAGQSYGVFSPTSQKIYLLLAHTSSPYTFTDQNGFLFPMTSSSPTTFTFTNQNGSMISMDLYESKNSLSTPFTITVI